MISRVKKKQLIDSLGYTGTLLRDLTTEETNSCCVQGVQGRCFMVSNGEKPYNRCV